MFAKKFLLTLVPLEKTWFEFVLAMLQQIWMRNDQLAVQQ